LDPIRVPKPSPGAFNRNRPVSDLIRAQVRHFQHLEDKLAPQLRSRIPSSEVATESGAARYIAYMTGVLRSEATARSTSSSARPTLVSTAVSTTARTNDSGSGRRAEGLAIAASEEDEFAE
jgi:hypothetical protein